MGTGGDNFSQTTTPEGYAGQSQNRWYALVFYGKRDMALGWLSFSVSQWDAFSEDEWNEFLAESADVSASSIYIGGFRLLFEEGSDAHVLSTVTFPAAALDHPLPLGSIHVAVNEDGEPVVMPQAHAYDEEGENVIGGVPLKVRRYGSNWYLVAKPAGAADEEITFFLKGRNVKAFRYDGDWYLNV